MTNEKTCVQHYTSHCMKQIFLLSTIWHMVQEEILLVLPHKQGRLQARQEVFLPTKCASNTCTMSCISTLLYCVLWSSSFLYSATGTYLDALGYSHCWGYKKVMNSCLITELKMYFLKNCINLKIILYPHYSSTTSSHSHYNYAVHSTTTSQYCYRPSQVTCACTEVSILPLWTATDEETQVWA